VAPEEIIEHMLKGERVLMRAYDAKTRDDEMLQIWKAWPVGTKITWAGSRLLCEASGGSVHYALSDQDVLGMEYHVGSGDLTEVMMTRVRLETQSR
jgi:hypothetical protein